VREKAMVKAGDKLALIGCERDGETCCVIIVKADKLGSTVKGFLGPMLKEALK